MLGDDESYIQHKETGRNIELHNTGSALVMKMSISQPGQAGWVEGGTKEGARVKDRRVAVRAAARSVTGKPLRMLAEVARRGQPLVHHVVGKPVRQHEWGSRGGRRR